MPINDEVGAATRVDDDVLPPVDAALAEALNRRIAAGCTTRQFGKHKRRKRMGAVEANAQMDADVQERLIRLSVDSPSVDVQSADAAESSLLDAITGAVSEIASTAGEAASAALDSATDAASGVSNLASDTTSSAAVLAGAANGPGGGGGIQRRRERGRCGGDSGPKRQREARRMHGPSGRRARAVGGGQPLPATPKAVINAATPKASDAQSSDVSKQ